MLSMVELAQPLPRLVARGLTAASRAVGMRSRSREHGAAEVPGWDPPTAPPSTRALRAEPLGALEAARLLAAAPRLLRAPRGDGHVVLDLPGWKAPEVSLAPLRGYLRHLGYDARAWGLGTNEGDPEGDAERFLGVVERAVAESGGPVSLVGWSLGGVIARETTRARPDLVRRVVTFGTPALGGPSYTVGAQSWGEEVCAEAARVVAQRDSDDPLRVPVTAIFSRRDGVVAWRACLDRSAPAAENVEVRSTHLGLGLDPDVWETVARRLAVPAAVPARSAGAVPTGSSPAWAHG